MSKLPVSLFHNFVIGFRSLFCGGVAAEMLAFEARLPSVPAPVESHSDEAASVVPMLSHISVVLGLGADAHIAAPAIKTIAIDVINCHSLWRVHKNAVEVVIRLRSLQAGIPLPVAFAHTPIARQHQLSVRRVDDRHSALGEENKRDTIVGHFDLLRRVPRRGLLTQPPGTFVPAPSIGEAA